MRAKGKESISDRVFLIIKATRPDKNTSKTFKVARGRLANMAVCFGQITAFVECNEQWATYIERFEHFVAANDIKDDKRVAVLLSVMGSDTYGLLRSIIAPRKPGEMEYGDIVATLQEHFAPKPLVVGERFRFNKRNQEEGETVAQYVGVLKKLAEHCEFGDYLDEVMRDRFVCGLRNEAIQQRLLTEKSLTFRKAVEVAVSVDTVTRESAHLTRSVKVEPTAPPANLRVIFEDHDIRKLTLPSGIPHTIEDLHTAVRQAFSVPVDFILHYMDSDFGNQFFTLSSTDLIQDKGTVKVVLIESPVMLLSPLRSSDVEAIEMAPALLPGSACPSTPCSPTTSRSSSFADAALPSPDQNLERSVPWPSKFPIPRFSFNTELMLERGNESYRKDGSLFSAPGIKIDVLEKLAETIYQYVAYPSSAQVCAVAQALVSKHPCLKEPGSITGYYGWQSSLKYKMGNYRSKLRSLGYPEVMVNSLKQKHPDQMTPAKNVKKPKKAEVNYLPPYPAGETRETLENERVRLIEEMKKKDNFKVINDKMTKTFSLRRQEVVIQCPMITDLKERWPALFTASQGGVAGRKIRTILDHLQQHHCAIEERREVVIRCLVKYLGEDGLIRDHQDMDGEDTQDPSENPMNVYIVKKEVPLGNGTHKGIVIVVEGEEALTDLRDVSQACAVLLGFTYSLNLEYPKKLKYTFEVFQKLFLELDSGRMSPKVHSLKNRLLT
ncbi:uncharacterized protein LOC118211929 isoform X2 [Anguilla anguilla]|uniref:uncharacterized protein LOC118211929 isoform X2 n=1 Tax=Anguilla anguilla TaxID=7936 RepID=UPI0015A79128|nr:uncharacterized protein LOC118211929 isoform X2 [Anguilla anguilla]